MLNLLARTAHKPAEPIPTDRRTIRTTKERIMNEHTMYQALLIPIDIGEPPRWVEISTYKDIQRHVGGRFDVIRKHQFDHVRKLIMIDDTVDYDMWVHDEGLILDLPLNVFATHLSGQGIHGPAVLTGGADNEGNTLPLDQDAGDMIISVIGPIAKRIANRREAIS